jgi:hypothetical protein
MQGLPFHNRNYGTLNTRLLAHDPVDLLGFPVSNRRDKNKVGRQDQDPEGD